MAVNSWQIDFGDISSLEEKMKQIPDKSERVINKTLEKKGIPKAEEEIQRTIPISKWKGRVINKKHARDVKALTSKKGNLQFTTRPRTKYNYLKYPDLAIGTSHKNKPKKIMKKGLDKAAPKILEELTNEVVNEINRTLGGN